MRLWVAHTPPFSGKYIQGQRKYPSLSRNGFTLVEIIVTLCIVAILTAIAIPGFKKATEDFRLNSTLEDTLDIMKACRAYYLIFNEWPPDVADDIPDKLCLFVSGHLLDPNRGGNNYLHRWGRRPLGKTSYSYSIDGYPNNNTRIGLAGIQPGTADWNKCYNKLKLSVGEKYLVNVGNRISCFFPESPGSIQPLDSNTPWENRYY
jgi:prepilin-type N-terminal cleavage/methylation domain-containing protein